MTSGHYARKRRYHANCLFFERNAMKTVMRYETTPESTAKAPLYFTEHRKRLDEFHARGVLLMAGPVMGEDGKPEGALGIFTTREAAEEFVRGDPFVLNGVAARWSLRDWREVLAP
jgi:uncharacterized protein YciI